MGKKKSAMENGFLQIVGIIIPSAWDADGKAISWAIADYNEKIYQLDMHNEAGRRVLAHMGKKIKLSGNMIKKRRSPDTIRISEYEIMEDPNV